MLANCFKPLLMVISIAASAAASAQLIAGGAPTGHRHKLVASPPVAHPAPNGNSPSFGDPLVGLTATQAAAFLAGRDEFESVETVEGGLGPIFNGNSCVACHSQPLVGGTGGVTVRRFGRQAQGHFDPLTDKGGSLLQLFATVPALIEQIPPTANVVTGRIATPLYGAGLIEAIPDAVIVANASLRKPAGIAGRPAQIVDVVSGQTRIGRFGWKAQQASLLAFAGDAYLNEMGITNRFFPTENAPNGNEALLAQYITTTGINDPVDPATGRSDIDAAADFMRLLAPPTPSRMTASALAGQRVFARVDCAGCHTPTLTSGPSPIAALANKSVPLYSDLLLHNMGKLADGIAQAAASPSEMRTAPLWGLHARTKYLHDGRATTINAAVLAHDGEAAASVALYRTLTPQEVRELEDFLSSI